MAKERANMGAACERAKVGVRTSIVIGLFVTRPFIARIHVVALVFVGPIATFYRCCSPRVNLVRVANSSRCSRNQRDDERKRPAALRPRIRRLI